MSRIIPFYPAAIAIWYVLDLYRDSGEPTISLARPLVVAVMVAVAVQVVFTVIARDRDRGALIAAMLIALSLHKVLGLYGMTIFLAVLAAPGLLAVLRRVPPPPIRWDIATRVFNAIGAGLVGITVLSLAVAGSLPLPGSAASARVAVSAPEAPDIYLILLDGHPRWDTLERWGADGRGFLRDLGALGLRPALASRSNYNVTALSVASMLDLRSITAADAKPNRGFRQEFRDAFGTITRGRALDLLHAAGYETMTIPMGYGPVEARGVDRFLSDGRIQDFEQQLITETVLRDIVPSQLQSYLVEQRRVRLDDALGSLRALARDRPDHPRFVLAHLALPHLPPAFTSDGASADGWTCPGQVCVADTLGWSRPIDDRIAGILGNVAQIDRDVLNVVRSIQADSERPPAIVVFSDHGARIDPDDRAEMFRNLFAASTPGHPDLFPDDVSLVEVLPTLLETYAGTSIPTPDDSAYWLDIDAMRTVGLYALTPMPPIDATSPPAN